MRGAAISGMFRPNQWFRRGSRTGRSDSLRGLNALGYNRPFLDAECQIPEVCRSMGCLWGVSRNQLSHSHWRNPGLRPSPIEDGKIASQEHALRVPVGLARSTSWVYGYHLFA